MLIWPEVRDLFHCGHCRDGRVCEQHPKKGWPHDDCGGPAVPCPICQDPNKQPIVKWDPKTH